MRYYLRWENRDDRTDTGWYLYEEPMPCAAWTRGTIFIVYDRPDTPATPRRRDGEPRTHHPTRH